MNVCHNAVTARDCGSIEEGARTSTVERSAVWQAQRVPGSLQDLLFNVRELVERARATLTQRDVVGSEDISTLSGGNATSSSYRDLDSLRPPATECHAAQPHADDSFLKASFRSLPRDVIHRYAKFLADQNEGDMCRITPERVRRRKQLYLQTLNRPPTLHIKHNAIDDMLDPTTKIGIYGSLPFLRSLTLLCKSINTFNTDRSVHQEQELSLELYVYTNVCI